MDFLQQASMDDLGFFNSTVVHSITTNQSKCFDSVTCQIDHTKVCVGDPLYCNLTRDEYTELLNDYIAPTTTEWILILSHSIVFLMGLVSSCENIFSHLEQFKKGIQIFVNVCYFVLITHNFRIQCEPFLMKTQSSVKRTS